MSTIWRERENAQRAQNMEQRWSVCGSPAFKTEGGKVKQEIPKRWGETGGMQVDTTHTQTSHTRKIAK
jgi:hypothetical protein